MNGWKKMYVERGKGTGSKNKQVKVRLCKICGKPSYSGTLCESCKQFIENRKTEERKQKYGKHRR